LTHKHTEEEYWLALLRAPGVGPVNFIRLIKYFGNPQTVFEAGRGEWQSLNMKEALQKYLQNPNWHAIEKDLEWLAQPNNHLLTFEHPDYPPILAEIDNFPPLLFVHGDCALLSSQQLAIVGTRHPSQEGERTAREFAEYLSLQGFTITSGMAYGIDAASHWGALAGSGKTLAVAGTGLDRVYPAKHRDLAHKIAETGALISELPIGTPIHRSQFPIRSRIVSGLSLGTLVVEAPERSGALYTARHAANQGREVFAIPGSIYNPNTKGCHQLIKEGAKLVESAPDILEELLPIIRNFLVPITKPLLQPIVSPNSTTTDKTDSLTDKTDSFTIPVSKNTDDSKANHDLSDLDEDYQDLLNYLDAGPTSIDNLVEQSGLTASNISSMLLILELRGLVVTQSGGFYLRKR
jgi:DNA processing protein